MAKFQVNWSVTEVINGPGEHDDGVRDGDRKIAARGSVEKEATSEHEIKADLTKALRDAFPENGMGSTYNIDRFYDIQIAEVT